MRRLILFAKRAEAGKVKTRMTPPLAPEQAADLHRAFVADGLAFLRLFEDGGCQVECWTNQDWGEPATRRMRMRQQCAGNLGARMLDTFSQAASEGAGATIILAADAPTLPRRLVQQAFTTLEQGADAVVTPAEDGGYVLIGACRPLPGLFQDVPWGEAGVLAATRHLALRHHLRLEETAGWYDVDQASDLPRLRQELATAAGQRRAPRTREALAAVWTQEFGSC